MDENIIPPANLSNKILKKDENLKKAQSEAFELLIQEDKYELEISLYNNTYMEFKIIQKNIIASCYYFEKYNLETINKISYIFCKDLTEVFQFYKKIVQKKKMNIK